MNYRDENPSFYSDLTSDGIMAFFEDERASEEDVLWMKAVLTSEEYQAKKNPISKWNWHKIKKVFAKKYFPEIAPVDKEKTISMSDRVALFLGDEEE